MYETQIFIPPGMVGGNWYATLLGRIVIPVVGDMQWYWFSHYQSADFADHWCEFSKDDLPGNFSGDFYRSVKIRYRPESALKKIDIERSIWKLCRKYGYYLHGFQPWDFVADLGSERFCVSRKKYKVEKRAGLVLQFYHVAAKLMLDNLVDDGNGFRLEHNGYYDDLDDMSKTCFYSLNHVFCNITNLKSEVRIYGRGVDEYFVGSRFSKPLGEGWEEVNRHVAFM